MVSQWMNVNISEYYEQKADGEDNIEWDKWNSCNLFGFKRVHVNTLNPNDKASKNILKLMIQRRRMLK